MYRAIIPIILAAFLSCQENHKVSKEATPTELPQKSEVASDPINSTADKFEERSENKLDYPIVDSTETALGRVTLAFEEFNLDIWETYVWDYEDRLKGPQGDSVIIEIDISETIQGKLCSLTPKQDIQLSVFQRFENSVTIMNEGPHCDLTEWKHYNSEWAEIEIYNREFTTVSYSEEEREQFIEVDMAELRETVRLKCGDMWAGLVKETKSPTEYPAGVSTSRIFLKIEGTDQGGKLLTEKMITFIIAMGC